MLKIIKMTLEDLGFNNELEQFIAGNTHRGYETGRVIAEHKERYIVATANGEFEAEITGNLRFTAKGREDFPAVGDWVALFAYDTEFAIIHSIMPRFSVIARQAAGQKGEVQVIAANVDYALIVQAVDRDFNVNRLERYLTICNASKVSPVIVLSKTDLIAGNRLAEMLTNITARIHNVPVIPISNESHDGYDKIEAVIERGKTYCLMGSSGVGKSTLLNNLAGRTVMQTGSISQSINRGRHVTSHRELIILDNGGILIDNPGMREVGITDTESGLEITFDRILELSGNCRFKDCTHTGEKGCSVLEAVENGEVDNAAYENFLKLEREKAHYESTLEERRKRERGFGKMLKNYKKDKNKY
jgi:ribosome biogenesis GTPase / thiamine phosphate phosphatase